MAPVSPTSLLQPSQDDLVVRTGFTAMVMLVFCFVSRIQDVTVPFLHIPMILSVTYLAAAGVSGRLMRVLQFKSGKAIIGFYACMIIAVPFSVWPGGSFETLVETARQLLVAVGVMSLTSTIAQTIKVMNALGYAAMTIALITFRYGSVEYDGRLTLYQGTLSDPNDLALALLMGLPFLYMKARNSRSTVVKVILYASMLVVLGAVARTGSRGGLLTLAGMSVVVFFRSPVRGKVIMAALAVMLLVTAPVLVPGHLMNRYRTLVTTEGGPANAVGSAEGRWALFLQSVVFTFQHPLLGVGPGMFAVAENTASLESVGHRGSWHETHNAYTQISSECGIPALLFYVFAVVYALRAPRRILKAIPATATGDEAVLRNAALALELSFAAFLTGSTFLSVAYTGNPYLLISVGACLGSATAPLLAERQHRQHRATGLKPLHVNSPAGLRTVSNES